jgi:small-conductance mechanosensitive channel
MESQIIQTRNLYGLLEIEPFILLMILFAVTWLFYKLFLNGVSDERHRNLKTHFQSLVRNYFVFAVLFVVFLFLQETDPSLGQLTRIKPYVALLSLAWGMICFVKTSRLLVLMYLFMGSMQAGVPLLIVNIFSLILTAALSFWSASQIFGVQLAPLLATSAAFSVVLGLAMQDTLGNLFAGISLQIDKSFEIGDWLEIVSGVQKAVGQVKEISWRSTTLVGLSDELLTLPNRFVAQAQISNFSPPLQPIVRSQYFKIKHGQDTALVKDLLERSTAEIGDVRGLPAPFAYVNETAESYISFKIIYFIDSYGTQHVVGDKVLRKGLDILQKNNIQLATQRLEVQINDKYQS